MTMSMWLLERFFMSLTLPDLSSVMTQQTATPLFYKKYHYHLSLYKPIAAAGSFINVGAYID